MANNDSALAVTDGMQLSGDPQEVQDQIDLLSKDVQARLEAAWLALHNGGDPDVDKAGNELVAIDGDMRMLSQFGTMAVAALAGFAEAIKVVAAQRDELVKANEQIIQERDEIQEEYDGLQEDIDGQVFERIAMNLYFVDWDDPDEVEQNMVDDMRKRVACLNYEGQQADAETLNQHIEAYLAARNAMVTLANFSVQLLTNISNKRRAEQDLEPLQGYLIPEELMDQLAQSRQYVEDDSDDDEYDDEDEDEDPDDVAF